jgi:hypothetical protein
MFSIERGEISFCECNKKLTIVEIRSFIGCSEIANFLKLQLMVDLIIEINLLIFILGDGLPYCC